MTKEQLERAIEIKEEIEETERAIKALRNNYEHEIKLISTTDSRYSSVSVDIPQEIVDFAIEWFTKAKEQLEKELEEL